MALGGYAGNILAGIAVSRPVSTASARIRRLLRGEPDARVVVRDGHGEEEGRERAADDQSVESNHKGKAAEARVRPRLRQKPHAARIGMNAESIDQLLSSS